MKITQTLTIAVTALLACGFVYSEDLETLLQGRSNRATRNRSHVEQFAQADAAKSEAEKQPAGNENPGTEERSPAEILATALEKLRGYSAVRAKITEQVALTSNLSRQTHRFSASGEYLQGQNLKLKMSLEVKLAPDMVGKLKEVCDGEVLWSAYELGSKEKTEIVRRDVRQILKAVEEAQQGARMPASEKTMQQAGLIGTLGLGGLPSLLAGLSKDFEYTRVVAEKIDNRDVLTLEGTWNATWTTRFQEAMSGNKKSKKDKTKTADPMPPNVPDVVRVSLDKETEFPRRIQYLKRLTAQSAPTPMVTLEFTDPKFNERLSRDEFEFILPADTKHRDDTQLYLQQLGTLKSQQAPAGPPANPVKTQ